MGHPTWKDAVISSVLLLSPAFPVSAEEFAAVVTGVLDGATLQTRRTGGEERIRLNGVDCPVLSQPFGRRAQEFTAGLALGKAVMVRIAGLDEKGQPLGEVFLADGANLGHALLKAGLAWWHRKQAPDNDSLWKLEAEARNAKRGLWEDPDPVPPWEWRKGF
jgi:endonuclease YncB( thermonuclease family)